MMQEKKIAEGSFEVTRCLGKTLKKKKSWEVARETRRNLSFIRMKPLV
jgi:hypothetical protein